MALNERNYMWSCGFLSGSKPDQQNETKAVEAKSEVKPEPKQEKTSSIQLKALTDKLVSSPKDKEAVRKVPSPPTANHKSPVAQDDGEHFHALV